MCAYSIFFFDSVESIDSLMSKVSVAASVVKKNVSDKYTFLYLLKSLKCRYNTVEKGQRYNVYSDVNKCESMM